MKYVAAYSPDSGGRAALAVARLFATGNVVVTAHVPGYRPRSGNRPLEIVQPDGPSFTLRSRPLLDGR